VPGYYQPVPPGQKPFAHRGAPRIKFALWGFNLGVETQSFIDTFRAGGKSSLDGANDTGWKPMLLWAPLRVAT
jgi:hypothetical protein